MMKSLFSSSSQPPSMTTASASRRPTRAARKDQPQQRIEQEAVDDVREGVPVGNLLRILRALHDAVPELDVAALADRRAAHRVEDGGLQHDQPDRDEDPGPRGYPARPCRLSVARRHCRCPSSSASRAIRITCPYSDVRSPIAPEPGLFVGADGSPVGRIGIDDDARRAFGEELVDELPDDRRAVADPDQLGPADRDVDAERAERLVLIGMVVLQMRVVALQIADRLAVELDDQRLDRDAVDVLADRGELDLRDRPTTPRRAVRRATRPASADPSSVTGRKL